eukprot:2626151-Prymnesium_polylepis.1
MFARPRTMRGKLTLHVHVRLNKYGCVSDHRRLFDSGRTSFVARSRGFEHCSNAQRNLSSLGRGESKYEKPSATHASAQRVGHMSVGITEPKGGSSCEEGVHIADMHVALHA